MYHFPGVPRVENLPAGARNMGSIPGWGRPPGEGNDNPLPCSCLENPMDKGACQATVHRVAESDRIQQLNKNKKIYTIYIVISCLLESLKVLKTAYFAHNSNPIVLSLRCVNTYIYRTRKYFFLELRLPLWLTCALFLSLPPWVSFPLSFSLSTSSLHPSLFSFLLKALVLTPVKRSCC